MSYESQTDPPEPGPKLSISASPPQGEASIPRASAPASTGCLLAPTHGDLSGLVESVWVLETRPASPGSWCATWDGDHSTVRGQGGHSPGPETRTKGFLHMSKARRHRRMTLIMQSGFPLGENPLVLSHHCRGLMYSRPKGITLDVAEFRPSSFWNCLIVSDRPSLSLLTNVRIDSIRAGDIRTCITYRITHHAQISGFKS